MLTLTLDLSKYIEYKFWDGKHPHIVGRRMRVAWIAYYLRDNDLTISELSASLSLTEQQVAAAMLFYEQHQAEIDALEQAEAEAYSPFYEN